MAHALGIDVEEWYHICGLDLPTGLSDKYQSRVMANTEKVLDILDALQTKATFFVLGVVAERFPTLIKIIDKAGHEIAAHGYRHIEVYKHSPDSFKEDIKKCVGILKNITKKPVLGYRAPSFSITNDSLWAIDVLIEEGIKYDCSIFPVRHPRYGIPSAPRFHYRLKPELVEFPPSTVRVMGENFPVAGGAYFRMLPYSVTKKAVERIIVEGAIMNFYLHVWEMDTGQPKLKLPLKRRFSHYAGIKGVQEKFEKLLADFQYAPVYQVIKEKGY